MYYSIGEYKCDSILQSLRLNHAGAAGFKVPEFKNNLSSMCLQVWSLILCITNLASTYHIDLYLLCPCMTLPTGFVASTHLLMCLRNEHKDDVSPVHTYTYTLFCTTGKCAWGVTTSPIAAGIKNTLASDWIHGVLTRPVSIHTSYHFQIEGHR